MEGGFGTGSDQSGILFLIDMDNRELYISTNGQMIRYMTDSRINDVLDDVYNYAADADYYGAAAAWRRPAAERQWPRCFAATVFMGKISGWPQTLNSLTGETAGSPWEMSWQMHC